MISSEVLQELFKDLLYEIDNCFLNAKFLLYADDKNIYIKVETQASMNAYRRT